MAYDKFTELLRPSRSVSSGATSFSTSWRILHAGSDTQWENFDCVWFVNGGQYASHYGQSSMTSDTLPITSRSDWYPYTNRKLTSVQARVRGTMASGYWGDFLGSPTLNLTPPRTPELKLELGQGATEEEVQLTVNAGSDTDAAERQDTVVTVTRRTSASGQSTLYSATSTDSTITWSENVSDIEQGLGPDGWIEITASARNRGFAGDSATVTKTLVFAWPGSPQITKVAVSGTVLSAGMAIISCKSNQSAHHPTTSVQLQRVKSNTATTPAEAALLDGWADVSGSVDDGDCAGLTDALADAWPQAGYRTWYRLKAVHGGHTLYSAPAMLPVFEPLPVASKAHVFGCMSGDDGKSLVVDVAWKQEQGTAERATQVAWSEDEHAWDSSQQPQTFDFTWEDPTCRFPNGGMYDKSARVYISGLEEGTRYYVRARRVQTISGTTTYGDWSGTVFATPASKPAWVNLQAPASIARGEGLPLTWTFGSDAPQTGWSLTDADGKVWGAGEDADGAFTIPEDALDGTDALTLSVAVTTGGEWASSEQRTVTVAERPALALSTDAVITSQPVTAALEGSEPDMAVSLSVTADGVAYERPEGRRAQYAGDVVWAAQTRPGWEWDETDGVYKAEVELPHMPLVNGASYTLSAVGASASTGLSSAEAASEFAVAFDHLASAPGCTVAADPANLHATLTPTAPTGAEETDVCDVYRLTVDGARLIAEGVAFGSAVTDRFAPYSRDRSAGYRVSTRTADGDEMWADFANALDGRGVRLDWEGKALELPYNLGVEETVEKGHEERKHLDGSVEGYFEAGVKRVVTITTDMVKRGNAANRALLEDVAAYDGPVFVRTPSGLAFDAAVDVTPITEGARSAAVGVTLKATEVALTDAHRCGPGDIDDPATTTTTTTGA